ncbi:hypothetical protein ALP02_03681 [Pseudomonas coronafaciens pv. garcae]|nr:hypothetical protein ALP71_00421 [Pseudomonas coronafaciens pv. garcae]RMU95188.1 hypothetical protein ALP20_00959 [Pseudomonas coronafaciens pv. coronafaciens]RMV91031.1 hypothetical protein ALP02_03681 [Pseudomonas coronafaciens pv. garcae]
MESDFDAAVRNGTKTSHLGCICMRVTGAAIRIAHDEAITASGDN